MVDWSGMETEHNLRGRAGTTRGWRRVLLVMIVSGLAGGCSATYSEVGASRAWAEYSYGALAADLPAGVRVPAVVAAAESSLKQRGYSVSSRRATAEEGAVEGKASAGGLGDDVDVGVRAIGAGTRVKVKVGLVGDEARSQAILDDVMRRLGL